jgi:4-amino-4-deoxy-L-arabinose transferase-like glycosyltransferase
LSSLTVVFLYLIALRLTSNFRASVLVAIGAACYPVFIIMSAYPPSLTLNTFVLALFMLLSVLLRDRNTLLVAALTGLALGLLILTRPISIGLLPVLLIWLWLNTSGRKLQLLKTTAILAVVAFLTVLPWTVRNYQSRLRCRRGWPA